MDILELGKQAGVNPMFQTMYAFGTIDSWLEKMDKYFANPIEYKSIINKLGQCGVDKELIDSMHIAKDFFNNMIEDLDNTLNNK